MISQRLHDVGRVWQSRCVVPESQLVPTEYGLVPKGPGWFVINAQATMEAAQRHGAGVERETTAADEACAAFPKAS